MIFTINLKNLTPSNLLLKKQTLKSIEPTITISKCLQEMSRLNVLSIAVQSHSNPSKIVNILNIFDLLVYIVDNWKLQSNLSNHLMMPVEMAMSLDADGF